MHPTRLSTLAVLALVTGGVAFVLLGRFYGSLPLVPRLGPATVALLAIAEAFLAHSTRGRLAGRPGTRPIQPIAVARQAALAKASSLVGAFVFGGYAGLLGYVAQQLEKPRPGADAITAALGLGAGLGLVVAALLLERACRARRPPSGGGPGRDH